MTPSNLNPADVQKLQAVCYTEDGRVKPKPECRASMINMLILDDMRDIDEAEDITDHLLRELNLWNEPRIEDLLRDDDEEEENTPDKDSVV